MFRATVQQCEDQDRSDSGSTWRWGAADADRLIDRLLTLPPSP